MMMMTTRDLMMVAALVVVLAALCLPRHALADQQPTPEERLKTKLFDGYDKTSLPQREINGTTTVRMQLMIQGTWIEEDTQVIHLNAWIIHTWVDPRLTWDHKDYGGLTSLHVGDHDIWQPGVVLYNNADITKVDPYGSTDVIIHPDGSVLWVPPATLRAECPMDITYWPYDTQSCYFFLGSWTRHGDHVNLELLMNRTKILTGWFIKYTHSWQYKGGQLTRRVLKSEGLEVGYVMLEMVVTFARVSPVFTYTVVLPAIAISLLTLLQFVLPMREPRRLMLGCISLVLTLLHLIYLVKTVPTLSSSIPIVVKFFGQTLIVIVISIGVSASLLRLTDTRQPTITISPPVALKAILTGPVGTVLFLKQYTEKVGMSGGSNEDGEVLEDSSPPSHHYEWLLVAAAVDRLAVIAFITTFFITLIAYVAAV